MNPLAITMPLRLASAAVRLDDPSRFRRIVVVNFPAPTPRHEPGRNDGVAGMYSNAPLLGWGWGSATKLARIVRVEERW